MIRNAAWILIASLIVACSTTSASESSAEELEKEAKIAAGEDAVEAAKDYKDKERTLFEGQLALMGDGSNANNLGMFATNDGKSFIVKVEAPMTVQRLKPYDGKKVALAGKARVNGKYLIVQAIVEPQPGPTRRAASKRGGV